MEGYQLPLQLPASVGGAVGRDHYLSPYSHPRSRQGKLPLCLCRQKHPKNKTSVNPVLCKEKEVVSDLHRDKSCLLIQAQGTGRTFMNPERKARGGCQGRRWGGEDMTPTKPKHQAADVDSDHLPSRPEALGLIPNAPTPQE